MHKAPSKLVEQFLGDSGRRVNLNEVHAVLIIHHEVHPEHVEAGNPAYLWVALKVFSRGIESLANNVPRLMKRNERLMLQLSTSVKTLR